MTQLTFAAAAFVAATALVGAQTGTTPQEPRPAGAAARQSIDVPEHTQPMDTRGFIDAMAVAGMAEVQLGKMATEKSANADVKAFGQMMVKDHTQAGNELMTIAKRMNAQPPAQLDAKHRELADRLSKLQGAAFDRGYIDAMVTGHEEVAAMLRTRAGNRLTSNAPGGADRAADRAGDRGNAVGTSGSASDEQALTQWATKTLPTVQQHLERARALQQKVR